MAEPNVTSGNVIQVFSSGNDPEVPSNRGLSGTDPALARPDEECVYLVGRVAYILTFSLTFDCK